MKVSVFLQIHMAEHLEKLNSDDLFELAKYSLDELYQACLSENVSDEQIQMIQRIYNYYQGPVPVKFENRIKLAPRFEDSEPPTNC